MSATFNWTISQCDRELADGGITTASGTPWAA